MFAQEQNMDLLQGRGKVVFFFFSLGSKTHALSHTQKNESEEN